MSIEEDRILATGALISCRIMLQYVTDPDERAALEWTIEAAQRVLDTHAATPLTASTV